MKTLTTIKAWISLICSIIVVSSATEHVSSHHDVSHHGDSIPPKKHQNTIVPFGIQIPDHVLSTKDVACISADSNIFEIMNKAQETCNGTDMRCTFYHFVNHGYQNIGTLDIGKELFGDLLMKFDNWLLTAEDIGKDDVPLEAKTKEDSSLDTASINVNGSYSNEESIENSTNISGTEKLYTNQDLNIDKVDHINKSDDDKIVNTHNVKNLYDTHHRNHHHKWKNGNHIKLVPEYNNDHRYFEVFLPKDKETGKPRTIYVEVDKDKNEFVLLDEEIDKKLNGIKPIRIELDELSEIADTAFNNIASNNKHHIYNSNDDDKIITSNVNTYSEINEDTTNLDIDVGESTQNYLNPSICNINANQQLISDNTTGNVKKIVNVSKNLVVSNAYINQAQFYVESQIDNTTDEIPNDHLELLESNNETEKHQTGLYKEIPLDITEFNENNTNIDLDLDNVERSPEIFDISCENDNDNSTENYELSTKCDNVTFYDDSFKLVENNNTCIDIDFDDTHDFSSSETIHLNEPISQTKKHVPENKLKSTPNIYTEPKLTSSLTAGILDYSSSQLEAIPSENRQGHTDLQDHSPEPGILLSPYTTVPLLGKDLAKVLETDGHLQSTFPVYATLDVPVGNSQNTPLNSDIEHPSIASYNSPLDSDFGYHTTRPKISTIFPSPPVECVVRLNKGSKYSPLNFGFSWLPSYSRIQELRLPCAVNSSPKESIMSLPELKNKKLTDSICPEPSVSEHAIFVEEPRLFQTVPSLSDNIQEPFLTTEPYNLVADTPMPPKHVLPSRLDLPKSNTDFDRIHTITQLSETPSSVMPYSFKDAVNSPSHMRQIPPYLQPTKPNLMDLDSIKYSPFDDNSKETMIPCSANRNRYPYNSIPCFANPYLIPPQFVTPYLEPLLPVTPLKLTSKIPTLDSLPTSLDQSYPYLNGDYRQETKPISLLSNTAFPPLNPLLLGPGFIPCQHLWNNIPHDNIQSLPCTILPDHNIRNYSPIADNYLNPSAVLQQNQIFKPLPPKSNPLLSHEQPCPIKNILEMTPSSYAPFSPVYTPPIQMNLNPSLALQRDLQSLSLKYGIPLSKIINSLETEISHAQSKTSPPTLKVPYSNLEHESSLISNLMLSKTNATLDDQYQSGYAESLLESDLSNLIPLDSSLIGPDLEIESSLMLHANNSQSHIILSGTTVPPSSHSTFENEPTKVLKDSSLIGPHLPILSTTRINFVLNDGNRNANEVVISESDSSNSILFDSSLIGSHLEIGSPPIVLDFNNPKGDILTSHTEVPITTSSQIEPELNLNQPTNLVLDSSLIGSHLPSLSPTKSLLSNEFQTIKDMIPLETDLTDLTPLDSPLIHTQDDLVNQLDQSEILQHEKQAVTLSAATAGPELHKPSEHLPTNLVEEELLFKSESSRLIPLDSSLIGSELKLESSPIITDSPGDKTIPFVSKNSIQNTENKVEELESLILPPSLLPTLLNEPVNVDSNLNIITQATKLNEEVNGGTLSSSLDTNVELPLTDISFKEKYFKIVEPIPELTSLMLDDSNIPLLTKKSSEIYHVVDSKTLLDSSLTGTSILHKLEKPDISTSLDSSIHLDSSLIGPSILQEIDSREISPILDSKNSLAPTTINQNKKPSEILTVIDSSIELESSFKGPTVHHEINSKETSTAFESVTQFDNSLVPSLHETKEASAKTSVVNSSQLDSSLIGPSLHQETLEVSRPFDSKDLSDSSLVGPHLFTAVPFSSDETQIINEELQPELDVVNLIPLDSSLLGPHVDFESEFEQSEISRYPELSKTSVSNPDVGETTEFVPINLVERKSPLEPIIVPSASNLEELLLSKFTNSITKSQLSPSELKPCDKLLSSIAKIASDNKNIQPSCKDLQTLNLNTLLNTPLSLQDELVSEFSPIIMTSPAQEFSPVESIAKALDSNYLPSPKTLTEPYAQGVPYIPTTPSPFVQMKPLIDRNCLGPNNIQNILQTSPTLKPVVGNAPVPFISSAFMPLTSEDFKRLLGLASQIKLYPQLSIPNMYTPGDAITPSSEWTTPSNILPLHEYIPLLPKNNSSALPSNLESTISNSEYNPIVGDDITSLLDENSLQVLKDMSILPFSQSSLPPTIPVFDKGEIVSPSLDTVPMVNSYFIQARPLLPISFTNPLVPSSIYNPQIRLHNPQNVPYMIQTPNISPCNLQPHSNIPLHSQFSEIIGPAPNLVTLPTESPKAFLQKLLSKPCIESPIILPSSSLDTMLQLPTASNELNNVPCQLPPVYFTPISPILTTTLSNAFTSPILPIYVNPFSISFAKPIMTPSASLPLNIPYVDSPLIPLLLPINPYTSKSLTPKLSSPLMPFKITPISDYPYPQTVSHNKPMPSDISYKPFQTYSSRYVPIHASPIPIDMTPGSPNIMTKLPPAMTSPISPVFYEPLSTPYLSPLPKSLTNLGLPAYSGPLASISLSTLVPTPSGLLSPSYLSPDIPTYSYSSLPAPTNSLKRPSNLLTPAYISPISPVSSSISSYNTLLSFSPISSPNPKIKPELQTLRPLPISNAVNPFSNTNQRPPINPNTLPIQSYATHAPTSNSNTQIKQNIPCEDALESSLLTLALTEEIPSYDVIEESTCTYSNGKDDTYYEEPSIKYPLESLSYTLAPEQIAETLPNEDFIKLDDLTPPSPVNTRASEPSLQTKLYQRHRLTPYTLLDGKPLLKPRPAPQLLQPPSSIETIQQNIYDNAPLVTSSWPLKHPVSSPTSILSSPLLQPLTPFSSAPYFSISSPLFEGPCIHTSTSLNPYNKLQMNEKLQSLSSSPYYSAPSQDNSSPPIAPKELKNILTPQVTPVFSQVPTNTPFVPVLSPMSLPKSQLITTPYILDNYIQSPSTHYEPELKTLTSQGSIVKQSPTPNYTEFAVPIISNISPLEMPIKSQYISCPISAPQSLKKTKPFVSPQYVSSILPTQITLQNCLPLYEAPVYYQPYIQQPTALASSVKNIFKSPPVALPYTVLPSVNMVEPVSTDLNEPQWSALTPQYSLPSLSLLVSKSSPIGSHSYVPYSRICPHIQKQPLTNHIIPSSLFMSSGTDFQTPTNKLSPLYNIPRNSYPSPSIIEPFETVPYYTPSRPLDTKANPQNILKPKSPLSNVQYTVPLSSSPHHLTQPIRPTDFYQTQPLSNIQYTTKLHSKLSLVPAQYASPNSAPMYTSLPLVTGPKQLINKPSAPEYSLPSAPVHDSPMYSSPLGRNPFLNLDFKPISEVPSYTVPKNLISSSILTPSESIRLSNLRPLDISQEPQNLYSSPITSSAPLSSSSLLKSLAKKLPQNSSQYQPHIISSNSQYVSQSPINNAPQLLSSTFPFQKNPLLQPLLTNSQNNAPLIPMHFSKTNTAFPEGFPIESVPSIQDIVLSNYLPSDSSNHKYSSPNDSLVSEIPETVTPINPSSNTPYIFLKLPFHQHFKSPVSALKNMPLFSNFDILEPSPKLSASESSPLSFDSLNTEIIEKTEPYELTPDLTDRFPALPLGLNQQRQLHSIFNPKDLPRPLTSPTRLPLLDRISQISPSKIPSFNTLSLLSDEAKLIDTTDFIPMSQIKPEPLSSNFDDHTSQPGVSPTDRNAPIPNTLSNILEPDILQLSPYVTLSNTEFPPPTYKQLPQKLQTPRFSNQILPPAPIYIGPQAYKDLIPSLSLSQVSLPSPVLSSTNIDPQLTTNPLTGGPFHNSPMSITPENWLQSPIFAKSLPFQENLIDVTSEKEHIQTLPNMYRPANKMTPQEINYPYEPKSTISEVFSELDSIKPVNPLLKSKEPYTEYIEDLKSNEDNYYDPESDNVSFDEKQLNSFEIKSFTKSLPEIINGLSVPNYNNKAQRPHRLSKPDHFYSNNQIEKSPQVFNIPTYNISPIDFLTNVASPYTTMAPEILKDFTDIPTKHFGSVPNLGTVSLRPSAFYPEITNSLENVPITNSYPQNYLNPCLKYSSQMKSPLNTIEVADTSEMPLPSYTSYNNIDDMKYSGYKTYEIPSFKSPQTPHFLGTPSQMYSPSVVTYSSPIPTYVKPSNVQLNPSHSYFNRPTEISEPLISQYQMTTPLQTKLDLATLQDSSDLNNYGSMEDITRSFDSINEDNELKTTLFNYINKRKDVENTLLNNDAELTIPIGNIAITRKEPSNGNTIETNNPSIGLKVWKSNVKIAQAELKLKFKDLSVNNFMPIVNNLDKYDMEEIRKIVKNYIDEKYGNHIEINEPYVIDNKYTVIKDFDHNAVDNKYNLLWPTNYV